MDRLTHRNSWHKIIRRGLRQARGITGTLFCFSVVGSLLGIGEAQSCDNGSLKGNYVYRELWVNWQPTNVGNFMGQVTFVGAQTVYTQAVTTTSDNPLFNLNPAAVSNIQLLDVSCQCPSLGCTPGTAYVSDKVDKTSFTITATQAGDTCAVTWQISPFGAGQSTSSASVVNMSFDGRGNFSAAGEVREIDQFGRLTKTPVPGGTYLVSPNCTAVLSFPEGGLSVVLGLGGGIFLPKAPVDDFFPNENMIGIGVRIE